MRRKSSAAASSHSSKASLAAELGVAVPTTEQQQTAVVEAHVLPSPLGAAHGSEGILKRHKTPSEVLAEYGLTRCAVFHASCCLHSSFVG